jgi:hypothetical protein
LTSGVEYLNGRNFPFGMAELKVGQGDCKVDEISAGTTEKKLISNWNETTPTYAR